MSQNSEKDVRKTLDKHFAIATDFVVKCSFEVFENNLDKLSRLDGSVEKENQIIIKGKCTTFNNENLVYLVAEKLDIGVTLLCGQKTIYITGRSKTCNPDKRPSALKTYASQIRKKYYSLKNNGAFNSMPASIEKFILRSVRSKVIVLTSVVSFLSIFFLILFIASNSLGNESFIPEIIITVLIFFGVNFACLSRYNMIKNHPEQNKNYQMINQIHGIDVINLELKQKLKYENKYSAITENYLIICSNKISVIALENVRYASMRKISEDESTKYVFIVVNKDKTFTSASLFAPREVPLIEQVLGQQLGIMTGNLDEYCYTYGMNGFSLQISDDFMSVILAYYAEKHQELVVGLADNLTTITDPNAVLDE